MKEANFSKEVVDEKMVFIDGLASIREAVQLMREQGCEALVVNKRDETDAYGLIDIKAINEGVIVPNKRLEEVSVYEISVKPIVTVSSDLNARYLPRLLHQLGLQRIIVEDKGELLGFVSLKSLIFRSLDG
jgi:signal-transduction protein with cAMP-binding, CBS, and nucleotidyltransferase domain